MALDAEIAFAVKEEGVGVIAALGVMTGQAGHWLAVARVNHRRADRMAEGSLGLMALTAEGVAVCLQHRRSVAAVGQMAGGAEKVAGVYGNPICETLADGFVAAHAQGFQFAFQQFRPTAGMGCVASGAGVAGPHGQDVIVQCLALFHHFIVTGKTDSGGRCFAALVTGNTAFGERRMQYIAQHSWLGTAVRIMAG